jgi:hypothetical protein
MANRLSLLQRASPLLVGRWRPRETLRAGKSAQIGDPESGGHLQQGASVQVSGCLHGRSRLARRSSMRADKGQIAAIHPDFAETAVAAFCP